VSRAGSSLWAVSDCQVINHLEVGGWQLSLFKRPAVTFLVKSAWPVGLQSYAAHFNFMEELNVEEELITLTYNIFVSYGLSTESRHKT